MCLSNKQAPELEEVYTVDDSMILEVEKDLEDKADESDEDKPIYVLRLLLSTHIENEEDWPRSSIFQTRVCCNGQVDFIVIDGDNCTIIVFEDAVKKLGLKAEPH